MAKITDIRPQTKNKSRMSVYIDGEFACGLEKLTVAEHRLKIGDEIDGDELKKAVYDSECASAFERSAKYLGARPRTESEMRTYLIGKGYGEDVADATVDKLISYGYVDDAEYCRIYIREYGAKFGTRKLESDLRSKGVDAHTVEEALENAEPDIDNIIRLAEKYLRSHGEDYRKLTAYLLGKGFTYDVISESLKEMRDRLSGEGE